MKKKLISAALAGILYVSAVSAAPIATEDLTLYRDESSYRTEQLMERLQELVKLTVQTVEQLMPQAFRDFLDKLIQADQERWQMEVESAFETANGDVYLATDIVAKALEASYGEVVESMLMHYRIAPTDWQTYARNMALLYSQVQQKIVD
jgi:hypothetical protein